MVARLLFSSTPRISGGTPKCCMITLRSNSRSCTNVSARKFWSSDLTSTSRVRK
jgi:hypothetical protein